MDRQGVEEKVPLPPNRYAYPRFSPDGNRIALEIHTDNRSNIFVYELASGQLRQLTVEGGAVPLWTPDGSQITFVTEGALWNIAADLIEEPQRLSAGREGIGVTGPNSWSADGNVLLWSAGTVINHLTLLEDGGAEYGQVLNARGTLGEANALFSPDGDWLSYQLYGEVIVQPYPLGTGRRQRITQGGGRSAVWARGGNELFFANEGQLWAIGIETKPTLNWQDPVALFEMPWPVQIDSFVNYDVTPDGQRFVFIQPREVQSDEQPRQIQVVLNWVEELKRLVPIEQ
jgi:Tol biopolymer transport system component